MPSTITRSRKNRRSRRLYGEQRPQEQPVPILVTAANPVTTVLTVTFDQPVSLTGVPQFMTDVSGAEPVSAVQPAPNQVAITYDASVAAAAQLDVGYRDPAIRNSSGGYVTGRLFVL